MRFYQLEVVKQTKTDQNVSLTEDCTYWFGTERDAVVARNELFKSGTLVGLKREQKIYPVDVPTDKAGLLKFLKDNVKQSVIL